MPSHHDPNNPHHDPENSHHHTRSSQPPQSPGTPTAWAVDEQGNPFATFSERPHLNTTHAHGGANRQPAHRVPAGRPLPLDGIETPKALPHPQHGPSEQKSSSNRGEQDPLAGTTHRRTHGAERPSSSGDGQRSHKPERHSGYRTPEAIPYGAYHSDKQHPSNDRPK